MALYATAGTLDDISAAIARFYCGESKPLLETPDPRVWRLSRKDGTIISGVRVAFKRGRYRFETDREG
jgi:hypothetical protein